MGSFLDFTVHHRLRKKALEKAEEAQGHAEELNRQAERRATEMRNWASQEPSSAGID